MVDRHIGTPALRAARAAWTSPRRAYMPAIPIGESTIGMAICWPISSVLIETRETSTSTRWRRWIFWKSSELARRVDSEKAPPST